MKWPESLSPGKHSKPVRGDCGEDEDEDEGREEEGERQC